MEACANCRFVRIYKTDTTNYECARFPPTVRSWYKNTFALEAEHANKWGFALTREYWWCGEWSPADISQDEKIVERR